jgi:hypothetical protein
VLLLLFLERSEAFPAAVPDPEPEAEAVEVVVAKGLKKYASPPSILAAGVNGGSLLFFTFTNAIAEDGVSA